MGETFYVLFRTDSSKSGKYVKIGAANRTEAVSTADRLLPEDKFVIWTAEQFTDNRMIEYWDFKELT